MLHRLLVTTIWGERCPGIPISAHCGLTRTISSISTVSLGTAYEHHVLSRLPHLLPGNLSLTRVGGAGDGGVDLRGWWQLPKGDDASVDQHASRLRVIVQCKASAGSKKHGPVILREVEGVSARNRLASAEDDGEGDATLAAQPLLAVICSSTGFSKQTNIQVNSLRGPANHIMLVHLPLADTTLPIEDESGRKELEAALSGQDDVAVDSEYDVRDDSGSASNWPLSILTSPSLTSPSGPLGGNLQIRWSRPVAALTAKVDRGDVDKDDHVRPIVTWQGQAVYQPLTRV